MTKNTIVSVQEGILTLPPLPVVENRVYETRMKKGDKVYEYKRIVQSKPNNINYRLLYLDYLKKTKPELNREQFHALVESDGFEVRYSEKAE